MVELYCKKYRYKFYTKVNDTFVQYVIRDGESVVLVNVYHTGTITVQGKESALKSRLNGVVDYFKQCIDAI